jgi:hypothetical protein
VGVTLKRFTRHSVRNFACGRTELPDGGRSAFAGQTDPQIEERLSGNPLLHPEVATNGPTDRLQPEMDQGLDPERGLVAYRHARHRVEPGAQFIINNFTGTDLVQTWPEYHSGALGPINLVIDPNENLSGAVFEGLDYEAIYILDSTIFGGSDWGRVTTRSTVPGCQKLCSSLIPRATRLVLQVSSYQPHFSLTSSLPRNRANISLFYDGPTVSMV